MSGAERLCSPYCTGPCSAACVPQATTLVALAALDELHHRVRWHYEHARDADYGDMVVANHAALRYAHVLDMIDNFRDELVRRDGSRS